MKKKLIIICDPGFYAEVYNLVFVSDSRENVHKLVHDFECANLSPHLRSHYIIKELPHA